MEMAWERMMVRLEEFLADNSDRPIYLAELCAATGTTERVLRLHPDHSGDLRNRGDHSRVAGCQGMDAVVRA